MVNQEGNPQDAQMQQVLQMVQQMLQQGMQPVEVAQKLLQEQLPPEAIMQVFTQLGMQPEEAQQTIQQAMQGGQQPQGQGEEQMEGAASNPQEEQMEQQGAPEGMPPNPGMAQGGNPDMQAQADQLTAQVQQMMQQGATSEQVQQQLIDAVKNGDIDEQVGGYVLQQLQGSQQQAPVARFGGNARALIRKALGGDMPEVDSTSNSFIQDRQTAFVNSIKKNALLHDFDNEFPSLKGKSAPKFAGGGPNPGDYKTAAEYKLALYEHNANEKDATKHLDVNDLHSKWTQPIKDGASGKWIGGKFVADEEPKITEGASGKWIGGKFVPDTAGQQSAGNGQYFNNTPEQQNLAKLAASPFGRFISNSGWDQNNMAWGSSGLPLTNDPNAKFNVTHAEAKKGIFGRRKVSFDLDWNTPGLTTTTPTVPASTTPASSTTPTVPAAGTTPSATVVGSTPAVQSTVDVSKDNEQAFETANNQIKPDAPGTTNDYDYSKDPKAVAFMDSYPQMGNIKKQWGADSDTYKDAAFKFWNQQQQPGTIKEHDYTQKMKDAGYNPDSYGHHYMFLNNIPHTNVKAFGGPSDDVVQSAMHILKMALGGMTYKNSYDFLPKAVDGMSDIPVVGLATNPNSMVWGSGTPTVDAAGNKIDPTLPENMQKKDNIIVEPNKPESGKGKITGKDKFKMDWASGMEAANNGMHKFGNWMERMHQNTPDKAMTMHSAMNTTRTDMNDQGNMNQWGENEGGINRGDQVQNMGNTYGAIDLPVLNGWNSPAPTFSHGGQVYSLGGAYDLTDEDVAMLEAAGIKLERTK